ncbi:MAG: FMN-binding protein [Treponema sp.]|jgi:electron transport complex protein RnfG|nr:FMN-binding protein [Treponema sp.]
MKGILKMGLVLAIYATAACVGLALVYAATKDIISGNEQKALDAALKGLFSDSGISFEDITGTISSPDPLVTFEKQYAAYRDKDIVGAAIRSSRGSYGGPITVLTGISADGRISGVKILSHQDTPGLGANAASETYYVNKPKKITFYGQFAGKSVGDPFEVKNDVDAITASTITSRAVADSVKAAGTAVGEWLAAMPRAGGAE